MPAATTPGAGGAVAARPTLTVVEHPIHALAAAAAAAAAGSPVRGASSQPPPAPVWAPPTPPPAWEPPLPPATPTSSPPPPPSPTSPSPGGAAAPDVYEWLVAARADSFRGQAARKAARGGGGGWLWSRAPSGSPDKPDRGGGGGGVSVPVVAALVATAVVVTGVVVGLSLWFLRGGAAPNGGGGASPTPLPFGWGRFTQYNPRASAWSYDRTLLNGPAAWGALTNASTGARLFPACAGDAPGARQSPVDLADDGPATRPQPCPDGCPLARTYTLDTDAFDVAPRVGGKPGFAIVLRGAGVAEWVVDGEAYKLDSFHYHSPSEHTWNGVRVPLEAHFVHVAADGRLAVFGVLYPPSDDEAPNPWMRPFWDEIYFPNRLPLGEVNVTALLADALGEPYQRYYRYDGSLTTPPCGEGVKWHVAVSRAGVSTAQRVLYQYAINLVDNHRDTQPLAGREVRRYN